MDVFGEAIAARFDSRGFAYFNRDVYDLFYPGYVDMWPMGHGALGMTYEQASARALKLRRSDGDLLTYGDGVLHHFTAALETALTAARHREAILRDYLAFRRDGVARGRRGPAEIVLHSAHDPGMAERLAMMLVENGIEVFRASGPVAVGDRTLPAGSSFIVPLDQPTHGFIHNLLDADVPDGGGLREAADRAPCEPATGRDLRPHGLESGAAVGRGGDRDGRNRRARRGRHGGRRHARGGRGPAARGARRLPHPVGHQRGRSRSPRRCATAFASGRRVQSSRSAAAATGSAPRSSARPRTDGTFANGWQRSRLGTAPEVVPIDDSYVREGMSLGSRDVRALVEPRVLLVYDAPGQGYSVGWARYVLERRYGQRTTAVRASSLGRARLADYDVIVFPSGNYGGEVGEGLLDRLRAWMRDGGTVITMGRVLALGVAGGAPGYRDGAPGRSGRG